jgi:hypothetical protein
MGKLPNSFRSTNRTTRQFRELFAQLPEQIQSLCRAACILFDKNLAHPSLRHHELKDTKKGQHIAGSFSVSITLQYRAIYVPDDKGVNVWYWIGTHADYDEFTGKK